MNIIVIIDEIIYLYTGVMVMANTSSYFTRILVPFVEHTLYECFTIYMSSFNVRENEISNEISPLC